MVEDVHALQAVGGQARGSVLAFPQVQAGGDVRRHRHPQRDDQRVLDEEGFGIRKGIIPGIQILGDGLCLLHQRHVLHHKFGGLAGHDAVLHAGAQEAVAGAAVAGFLIEGVHLGFGVGVIGTPVVGHQLVGARPAHRVQEVVGRALGDDDVHKVEAVVQHALHLLLEHLTLLVPVHHGGVVGILHLDGEGDTGSRQFFHCGIAVLLGGGFVKEIGQACQPAAFSIIHALAVGAEGRRGDGVQLIVFVALGRSDGQSDGGIDGIQERLAEVGGVDGFGPVVRLIFSVHAGHGPVGKFVTVGQEVEDVEIALAGLRALHGHHVPGGVIGQPAVQNVRADGGLIDLAALDHLRAADELFLIVDVAHRIDINAVGIVVLGVLLHHPAFQRGVLGQIERAAAAGGLGTGAELVGKLLQQRAVGGLVGGVAQQAEEARKIKVQGVVQGVLVHSLDPHGAEIHSRILSGSAVRSGGRHSAVCVDGVGGAVLGCGAVVGVVAVDTVVVIIVCTGHIGGDKACGGGSIVRVQHIGQRIHKVLRSHRTQHLTIAVHPVLVPQVEGPGQAVSVPLPSSGKALPDLAAVVVFHQCVDALGAVVEVRIGRADQIVQGGGLAGVQHGIGGAAAGSAGAAAIGSGGAAAAAQQTGSCSRKGGCTAALQELTAGNGMTHSVIPLSSSSSICVL